MKTPASSAAREISHWRHFFRTRDAALQRAGMRHAVPRDAPDTEYAATEWAETEWPDTDIDPRGR